MNGSLIEKVIRGLLVLLLALILLVAASFVFLMTGPGGRWLKSFALGHINPSIAGDLSIGRLKFRGTRIELDDLVLRAPDGTRVAWAGHVVIVIDLGALLHGRNELRDLQIHDYGLHLARQPEGEWNLSAALASTRPQPERGLPSFAIDRILFDRGKVHVLPKAQIGSTAVPALDLRDLGLRGGAGYRTGTLNVQLAGQGRFESPTHEDLTFEIVAGLQQDTQTARLSLTSGQATLRLMGQLPPGRRLTDLASVDWREIDAGLYLSVAPTDVLGSTFGPLFADIRMDEGRLAANADLTLPGLKISLISPPDRSSISATLKIRSLAATAQALEPWVARPLPPLDARGSLQARVQEPLRPGTFDLSGRLQDLVVGTRRVHELSLKASVASLQHPLGGPLLVDVTADHVLAADRRFVRPSLRIESTPGGSVSLEARVGAPYPLHLTAEGDLSASADTIVLGKVRLRYPNTTWALAEPARLRLLQSGPSLDELMLVSGRQELRLALSWDEHARWLALDWDDLRVASLPAALVRGRKVPDAQVDGNLRVDVSGVSPQATFQLSLERMQSLPRLLAELSGSYRAGEASGKISAVLDSARADGSVTVALDKPEGARTLEAKVTVTEPHMAELLGHLRAHGLLPKAAKRIVEISGDFKLTAQASGTLAEPEIAVQVALREGGLVAEGVEPIRDLTLYLDGNERHLYLRNLSGRAGAGRFQAQGALHRTGEEWRARYELELFTRRFPVPASTPVWVSLRARLTGIVSAALVTGNWDFSQVLVTERPASVPGPRQPVGRAHSVPP